MEKKVETTIRGSISVVCETCCRVEGLELKSLGVYSIVVSVHRLRGLGLAL